MTRTKADTNTVWHEGQVDNSKEHMALKWAEDETVICLLQPDGQGFVVDFVGGIDDKLKQAAKKELDFYLIELKEPDPWAYAKYHCWSTCNVYAEVRWVLKG